MFRHKKSTEKSKESASVILSEAKDPLKSNARDSSVVSLPQNDKQNDKKSESEPDLRDLMEKNLKWSQIIYEQNRKINRKLAWSAAAGWLRTILIATPIILGLWYLPTFIDKFQATISGFTGLAPSSATGGKPAYSIEQLMQLLPLGDAEKAQLKAILK